MKSILNLFAALFAFAIYTSSAVAADEKHDHDHDHDHAKIIAGPNGGRVLISVEPHLEFLVMKDRRVRITAVSHDDKPKAIALDEQSVKVIAGKRRAPTRLKFIREENSLISDGPLPDGMNFPVVVQIKVDADSRTVIDKFQLNLQDCPTCDYKEYACVCDHHAHDH
ncbi:MAG: hypothetical protein ACI8UO_003916 [Verrucomicrobiales bacterium]|jgi:hypothetical protein